MNGSFQHNCLMFAIGEIFFRFSAFSWRHSKRAGQTVKCVLLRHGAKEKESEKSPYFIRNNNSLPYTVEKKEIRRRWKVWWAQRETFDLIRWQGQALKVDSCRDKHWDKVSTCFHQNASQLARSQTAFRFKHPTMTFFKKNKWWNLSFYLRPPNPPFSSRFISHFFLCAKYICERLFCFRFCASAWKSVIIERGGRQKTPNDDSIQISNLKVSFFASQRKPIQITDT